MTSTNLRVRPGTAFAALVLSAFPYTCVASPISKRNMTTGARAGLGIGIAVAAIIVLCIAIFLAVHVRRSMHIKSINRERAILAGEKNKDGSDKLDKYAPQPTEKEPIKRNKSVKDRLMGPLYRGSTIDLLPMPKAHFAGRDGNRASTATADGAEPLSFLNKPWNHNENSPRPSFSSKRATRMMMMM